MRVVVSGASGLIGSALVQHLGSRGHQVLRLVRGRPARDETEVAWDPAAGALDPARVEGVDGAVNLSGASIFRWPWTKAHERRVLQSRTRSTSLLAGVLAGLARKPRVFVSVSAVGYYGSRGNEILREDSPPGAGFLAEVCREWEAAAAPAGRAGIRVVTPRLGIVLSGKGGALPVMALPFRLGLGGRIGDGRQHMSWIALADLVDVLVRALERDELAGPVNAVSPGTVTNAEFAKTLGRVLKRPAILPVPAFAARLLFGGMADELVLASQRAASARLLASGHIFRFPTLEGALRAAVKGSGGRARAAAPNPR